MKNFQHACAVAILTAAMAVSASANSGTIHCPGATAPPPPSGEISSPGVASPAPGETLTPPSITTTVILTLINLIS